MAKMIATAFVICSLIALLMLSLFGIVQAVRKEPKDPSKAALTV
jgi:hypothetical protein